MPRHNGNHSDKKNNGKRQNLQEKALFLFGQGFNKQEVMDRLRISHKKAESYWLIYLKTAVISENEEKEVTEFYALQVVKPEKNFLEKNSAAIGKLFEFLIQVWPEARKIQMIFPNQKGYVSWESAQ